MMKMPCVVNLFSQNLICYELQAMYFKVIHNFTRSKQIRYQRELARGKNLTKQEQQKGERKESGAKLEQRKLHGADIIRARQEKAAVKKQLKLRLTSKGEQPPLLFWWQKEINNH